MALNIFTAGTTTTSHHKHMSSHRPVQLPACQRRRGLRASVSLGKLSWPAYAAETQKARVLVASALQPSRCEEGEVASTFEQVIFGGRCIAPAVALCWPAADLHGQPTNHGGPSPYNLSGIERVFAPPCIFSCLSSSIYPLFEFACFLSLLSSCSLVLPAQKSQNTKVYYSFPSPISSCHINFWT